MKKKIKSIALICLTLVLILTCLTGCGAKSKLEKDLLAGHSLSETHDEYTAKGEPTELWGYSIDSIFYHKGRVVYDFYNVDAADVDFFIKKFRRTFGSSLDHYGTDWGTFKEEVYEGYAKNKTFELTIDYYSSGEYSISVSYKNEKYY